MFERDGASAAVIGRRRDKLEEVAAEIGAFGGSVAIEALDVADRAKVGKAADRLIERFTLPPVLPVLRTHWS